jgi:violaxanthin de-epoxidase
VARFDTRLFEGRWYISEGLNAIFDTFACQVHFFTAPTPSTLYGQLNWRIQEPDGEFFTRDVIQKFVADPKQPGVLYNHDNEYLHYEDDWYILDYDKGKSADDPDAFVLVYYRGRNDAWVGYGGAVLYTRTPAASPATLARAKTAWDRAALPYDFAAFAAPDNACAAESAGDRLLLREQYASKMLLTGERALQEEATQVRSAAASTIRDDVRGAEAAATRLEGLVAGFEKEVARDVVSLEREVVKDATSLEREVERDLGGLFKRSGGSP